MHHKLKIALVSSQREWRGGEEQLRLLSLGLASRGHAVKVFVRAGSESSKRLPETGIDAEPLHGLGLAPWSWWALRRRLIEFSPDVLHVNDPQALSAASAAEYGLSVPACLAARRVNFPIRNAWRYNRFCDKVLAISESVFLQAVQSGVHASRLAVVPDGLDFSVLSTGNRELGRSICQVQPHQTLLLCVAALTYDKGHDVLLQSLPAVFHHFPHLRVALAGEGELRGELIKQAFELGLSDKVKFLGFRRDVADLLAGADFFVMASRAEGLCTALIDAMAAGLPAIATSAGGMPEAATPPGGAPLIPLVPPCDSDSLSRALLEALHNPEESRRNARQAQAYVRRAFTADRMVESTLAQYWQVFSEQAASKLRSHSRERIHRSRTLPALRG